MDGRDNRIIRKEALQEALMTTKDMKELVNIRNELNHINLDLQSEYNYLKDSSTVMSNLCGSFLRSEVLTTTDMQELSLFVDLSLSNETLPLPIYGLMLDISMMLHDELSFRYIDATDDFRSKNENKNN